MPTSSPAVGVSDWSSLRIRLRKELQLDDPKCDALGERSRLTAPFVFEVEAEQLKQYIDARQTQKVDVEPFAWAKSKIYQRRVKVIYAFQVLM
jgi:hypothetical protein